MNIWGKRRIPDFSDSLFKENCQIAFMGISMAMGWLKIFGLRNEDTNTQYDQRFVVPNSGNPILVQ